jgi:dihydroorotase
MIILLKKGRVIDPANNRDEIADILIENSKIKDIRKNITVNKRDWFIIYLLNKIVAPGLIDVHVHFREPGFEYKETIKTGSRAAAMGGFTTVICEPNTSPPVDNQKRVIDIYDRAKKYSIVNLYTKACISKGMRGKTLVDVSAIKSSGAVAISEDGNPVEDQKLMKKAFRVAKQNSMLVNPHSEQSEFSRQKDIHKLYEHTYEPFEEETVYIKRDLSIISENDYRTPLHISHVSFKTSVEEIKKAKEKGLPVTAEATPHHIILTKDDSNKIGTNAKVNPPLRTKEDTEAIKYGLKDGIIDVIATDHAPHAPFEKNQEWGKAPYGIIGLETSLGIVLTHLVNKGILSINDAIAKMTINPARIFGLNCGKLDIGSQADITIIDPLKEWTVDVNKFESMSKNCPFNGWKLKGKAFMVIVQGKIVMENDKIIDDSTELFERYFQTKKVLNLFDDSEISQKSQVFHLVDSP